MASNQQTVPGWFPRQAPAPVARVGRTCRLDPLIVESDGPVLHAVFSSAPDDGDWDFLPYGPFGSAEDYRAWLAKTVGSDPLFYTIRDRISADPAGVVALMRIDPANGAIEIGHVLFSRSLQKTPPATEAIFLLLSYAIDGLGYRRVEWKCDAANARSCRAAERLGFTFEGTFRQHRVVKGRNRDTAWFSLLDREWPARKAAVVRWLDPSNFDSDGRQLTALR